jgi:predicted phosphodiesterase
VLGNHDAFLFEPSLIHEYTEAKAVVTAVDWCREQLSDDEIEYLRRFSPTLDLDLGHGLHAHLFHGSPRNHTEDLMADAPAELLDEVLPAGFALYAGGHTHFAMVRQHRGAWVVNPGSCGMPFSAFEGGIPVLMDHAAYALIDSGPAGISCTLRRVAYDREAYAAALRASDNPLAPWLLGTFPSLLGSAPPDGLDRIV